MKDFQPNDLVFYPDTKLWHCVNIGDIYEHCVECEAIPIEYVLQKMDVFECHKKQELHNAYVDISSYEYYAFFLDNHEKICYVEINSKNVKVWTKLSSKDATNIDCDCEYILPTPQFVHELQHILNMVMEKKDVLIDLMNKYLPNENN